MGKTHVHYCACPAKALAAAGYLIQRKPLVRAILTNLRLRIKLWRTKQNRRRMTMSQTLITSRDPKGLHATRLFEVAYNNSKLNGARAQRLNECGGELQDGIAKLIAKLSVSGQFADEEVRSSYAYPEGYVANPTLEENLADLEKELATLRACFPELATADYNRAFVERICRGEIKLPEGAERWTLIPKWETLVADLPAGRQAYGEAGEKVLEMIASKRKFYNYRDGQLGANHLRQHGKSVEGFGKLGDEQKANGQPCDILVVPAQFGLRHKGRSVRLVREVFTESEFGLGAFAIGIMVLTHPERLVQWEQLHVDCAGDEFSSDAEGDFSFSRAPLFVFYDGKVKFYARWYDRARENCGSASAFVTQQPACR